MRSQHRGVAILALLDAERPNRDTKERVRLRHAAPLLVIAAVVVSCSSTLVEVTVMNGWHPVRDVEVAMDCPQVIKAGGKSPWGRTDETGRFEWREPGGGRWLHDGCTVWVGERAFPMKSVCVEYRGDHCVHVVVETDVRKEDLRVK